MVAVRCQHKWKWAVIGPLLIFVMQCRYYKWTNLPSKPSRCSSWVLLCTQGCKMCYHSCKSWRTRPIVDLKWKNALWAVVVAQRVQRLLPTSESRGSHISHQLNLYLTFVYCQLYWKGGSKEKEAGNSLFIKNEKVSFVDTYFLRLSTFCYCHIQSRSSMLG